MQRTPNPGRGETNRGAERDAAQPMGGQPRTDDEDDELQNPDTVRSRLTAREFEHRDPRKLGDDSEYAGERDASASFDGPESTPPIDDDNPPRGDRGAPLQKTNQMLKERK